VLPLAATPVLREALAVGQAGSLAATPVRRKVLAAWQAGSLAARLARPARPEAAW
jgi:hypothetical protein